MWGAFVLRAGAQPLVVSLLGLARGLQNASVHKAGGVSVALTYVTGTLVHFGRTIAAAVRGASSWRDIGPFLTLWTALVAGGVGGAFVAEASPGAARLAAASAASILVVGSLSAELFADEL